MLTKDTKKLYDLPHNVEYCNNCTISNQRPRITFNNDGVCSACEFSEFKRKKINWNEREKELVDLCDKHRKNNGMFDCIVPCSGGKDGSFVAHQLKYKYSMSPLTVTWSPLIPTEIGKINLSNFIKSGFSHILGTPNPKITRKLTKLSFDVIGDPFQPFIYGQTNFPLQIAVKYGIKLIFYGENGEVEYGGNMDSAFSPTRKIEQHNKMYFSNYPPESFQEHGINREDLSEFMPPSFEAISKNETEIHFFGYYKFWDPQENYYYCIENTNFTPNDSRSEGTYSKYASLDDKLDGFHYYLSFIKFGIGRATSDSAHEIRDNKIERDEGIALIRQFDSEFPNKYFQEFLDYIEIDQEKFTRVIDSWRSEHIWKKTSNGWELKKPIYE